MATRRLKPITQSHWVVECSGFPSVYFNEFSGVKEKTDVTRVADGVRRRTYPVAGMTSTEPATLSVPYDPEQHDTVVTAYEKLRDSQEISKVTITPVDGTIDPKPVGKSFNLFGAIITGCEIAVVNRGSSDVSMLIFNIEYDEFTRS